MPSLVVVTLGKIHQQRPLATTGTHQQTIEGITIMVDVVIEVVDSTMIEETEVATAAADSTMTEETEVEIAEVNLVVDPEMAVTETNLTLGGKFNTDKLYHNFAWFSFTSVNTAMKDPKKAIRKDLVRVPETITEINSKKITTNPGITIRSRRRLMIRGTLVL